MKRTYIPLFAIAFLVGTQAKAQSVKDSTKNKDAQQVIDLGLRSEKAWRSTASTYTITGDELARTTAGNLLNTLQGRIPGLTVSTGSGEPGYDNPTFYVRGQSSWNIAGNRLLILLDGYPVELNAIGALSPYEVETVTLMKDAAATAIYGLESGAGVLSIRTKKGTQSSKIQISANGRYGILTPIELPKVMNAYDYTRLYNQALQNDNLPIKFANPELYKSKNDPYHPNVDWYDELLKKTSTIQDYNVTFRGGSDKARYFVLMSYTNFEGLYKNATAIDKDFGTNAKYTKLNLRANADIQLSKNLSIGVNLSGVTEDKNTPNGFTAATVFNNLLRVPSAAFAVKNPNGTWGNSAVYNFNPVQLLQQNGIYNSHTRNLQTAFNVTERLDALVPGLALVGGVSFNNQYVGTYQKAFTVQSFELLKNAQDEPILDQAGNPTYRVLGASSQSISDGGNQHWNRTAVQVGLTYERSFGKHTFSGIAQARRQNFNHDGQVYQVRSQGLLGAVTYDYNSTYIVDLSASYNGSADYAAGQRYGLFPAIGLGWIVTNERFLKDNAAIDFLKVRASYGITGNMNEDARFLFEQWGVTSGSYILGTNNASRGGRTEGALPNSGFTWEEKKSFNFGFDMKLWKKINVTADVFSERRTGILDQINGIPAYTGFAFQRVNTGEVSNKGFELGVTFKDKIQSFEYYAGVTAAFARNKIERRSDIPMPHDYLYQRGYRIGQMRGLQNDGFYQQADFDANGNLLPGVVKSSYGVVKPGDLKFKDQDGNGIVNMFDVVPINYAKLPEMTWGFNLGFKYKGFDFDAFIQAVTNRTVSLLDDAYDYTHPFVNNNNITIFSNNAWTPETATTATSPRLSTLNNDNNNVQSDFWMRNGNFLKVRSLELGYTLPHRGFLRKIDLIRVFVIGNNLISWDKLDNMEAERMSMGYPLMKSVSFGLNAKF
ncbi:TonB-linked SusC/RagA family outer membrane protein [Chitinophaga skermanii]|uniref:TonB-linked SusC/RagA family outer membrane protein n=1 Tax=Chitinophaga skermanii TaxID=331697 RepID=A0A327Q0M5_9BACT|nr:SusC/RagA family TonB-linked outer membrane protein [Chitinophaga skermanii]RAI97593.1 TonB-linked SusC/RagA family outer membrane protein [Chitinophaga skermanii]